MEHYKQLYDNLLHTEELKDMFPKMTGNWDKDKKTFIAEQKEIENLLKDIDVYGEEDPD